MKKQTHKITLIMIVTFFAVHARADDVASLTNNPFARPPSTPNPDSYPVVAKYDSGLSIYLQATMVGTTNKLANVSGKILRTGDEIKGFTLVQILEDRAVFSRDGKLQTVFVRPERVDENE